MTQNLRSATRAIEQHVKTLAATPDQKNAILSQAQSLTQDEHAITVYALVKRRLRRAAATAEAAQ